MLSPEGERRGERDSDRERERDKGREREGDKGREREMGNWSTGVTAHCGNQR